MSHDRGCSCGREGYHEYVQCPFKEQCIKWSVVEATNRKQTSNVTTTAVQKAPETVWMKPPEPVVFGERRRFFPITAPHRAVVIGPLTPRAAHPCPYCRQELRAVGDAEACCVVAQAAGLRRGADR